MNRKIPGKPILASLTTVPLLILTLSFLELCLNCSTDTGKSSCHDLLHAGYHRRAELVNKPMDSLRRELELRKFRLNSRKRPMQELIQTSLHLRQASAQRGR